MNRRLLLLNGLAIVVVVVSHSAGWGQGVMTSEKWLGIFQSMGLQGYDRFPGPAYIILTVIRMLSTFAVPTFFFVTGFFIAYANRGATSKFSYRQVMSRIGFLFVPYTFWSILIFSADFLLSGQRFTLLEYLWIYLSFGAAIHYYYVPALALFYLLTPLLIPFIRNHARPAFFLAAILQVFLIVFNWLTTYQYVVINLPDPFSVTPWFPAWWISRWVFFGTFGIICGFAPERFTTLLAQNKRASLIGVTAAILVLIVVEIVARLTNLPYLELIARLMEQVYALLFIFNFLTFQVERMPLSKSFTWISSRIYGIYLLHFSALDYMAHGLGKVFPSVLGYQIIFQVLLISAGLGLPLLFMWLVAKSPLKKHYRFFFG